MYSPVLKATLESPLKKVPCVESQLKKYKDIDNTTDSKTMYMLQRIEVKGFTHETVQIFVRFLQGQTDEEEIKTYDWKKIRGLYEMSHFYQVDDVLKICEEKGKSLIITTNILEPIELMEMFDGANRINGNVYWSQ